MLKIRKGCFETNSSSMHSLSFTNENEILPADMEPFLLPTNTHGFVELGFDAYGWGWATLTSQYDKLKYLMTMIVVTEMAVVDDKPDAITQFVYTEGFKMLNDFVKSQGLQYSKGIDIRKLSLKLESYQCNAGVTKYYVVMDDGESYIDHQSHSAYSSLNNFLEKNNTNIPDIVLNRQCWIEIDNDNH